jgi:hypothetical protein
VLLQAALADIPRQAEAAEQRAAWEADITNHIIVSASRTAACSQQAHVQRQPCLLLQMYWLPCSLKGVCPI